MTKHSGSSRWWTRRRDTRRRERERTGDTPQKVAEDSRRGRDQPEQSVEDAAKQASTGLSASSPPFQG